MTSEPQQTQEKSSPKLPEEMAVALKESLRQSYINGRLVSKTHEAAFKKGVQDGATDYKSALYQEPLNLKFKYLEGKEISRAIKEGERRACIGVIQNTGIFTCSILGVGFLLAPQVMTPTMIGVSIAVSTGAGVFAQKLLD